MDHVKGDNRFSHIAKDPRFHQLPQRARKVKIDKRFKSMFDDKKFKLKYTVDKRGRPINTTTNENLRRFYELTDSESESEGSGEEEDREESGEDELEDKKVKKKKIVEEKRASKKELKEKKNKKEKENPSLPKKGDSVKKSKVEKYSNKVSGKPQNLAEDVKKASLKLKKEKLKNVKESSEEGSDSEEEEEEEEEVSDDEVSEESESENDERSTEIGALDPSGPDLARGEGLASSSSDEDLEDSGEEGDDFEHKWGELDHDAVHIEEATRRLAVCNMDWDRIKAQDIILLVNSFKPQGGVVHSVKIYPSEFGLERMKEEEMHGPRELTEEKLSSDEEDPLDGADEKTSGSKYHREKLRQYQLNRLKYYYAVVECDSKETANAIYKECDGMEYESSSARLDFRFIPEDMEFDHEPKSVAKDMPDISTYKPSLFFTTALNQSRVALTWDETDQDRLKVTMKKLKPGEIDEMDVRAYLASSSEEEQATGFPSKPHTCLEVSPADPAVASGIYCQNHPGTYKVKSSRARDDEEEELGEDDDKNRLSKYKALLQGIQSQESKKEEKGMEMEISWEPGLRETTEDLVKKKAENKDTTPWEQYLKRKKEKKKKKREEKGKKETKVAPPSGDDGEAFSDDDLPAGIDLNDPYFKEEMEGSKKEEKGKKKKKKASGGDLGEEGKQNQAELQLLMMDEDDDHQHFSLKEIMEKEKQEKKKRKKKKKLKELSATKVEDTFKMNVNDPRFDAMYKSHLYNIDPSSHEFKKTKAMDSIIEEKLRRKKSETEKRKTDDSETRTMSKKIRLDDNSKQENNNQSLLSLVKSVKMKTQRFKEKKQKGKS